MTLTNKEYENPDISVWKTFDEIGSNRKHVSSPTLKMEKVLENSGKEIYYYIWVQAKKSFNLKSIDFKSNYDSGQFSNIKAPFSPFTLQESDWYEEGQFLSKSWAAAYGYSIDMKETKDINLLGIENKQVEA